MSDVQTTYLGWEPLAHDSGCARPVWDVDTRYEPEAFRTRTGGASGHSCPNGECDHADLRVSRTTVRIVCRSCGRAYVLASETQSLRREDVRELGYGQVPVRKAGLWLWPGAPLLSYGRDALPWGYLVTRERVERVSAGDVIGEIGQHRGTRGGVRWSAAAIPTAAGPYGIRMVRWGRAVQNLTSVSAAAKWIAAQSTQCTEGGEPS